MRSDLKTACFEIPGFSNYLLSNKCVKSQLFNTSFGNQLEIIPALGVFRVLVTTFDLKVVNQNPVVQPEVLVRYPPFKLQMGKGQKFFDGQFLLLQLLSNLVSRLAVCVDFYVGKSWGITLKKTQKTH